MNIFKQLFSVFSEWPSVRCLLIVTGMLLFSSLLWVAVLGLPSLCLVAAIMGGVVGDALYKHRARPQKPSLVKLALLGAMWGLIVAMTWLFVTGIYTQWYEGWMFVVGVFALPIGILLGIVMAFITDFVVSRRSGEVNKQVASRLKLFMFCCMIFLILFPFIIIVINSYLGEYAYMGRYCPR